MKKLIYADDLMAWSETVELTDDGGIDINDFEDKLKSMPTIEAEPHWIPVSERLPKESDMYLVTLKTDGVAYLEDVFPKRFVYVIPYDAVAMRWGYGDKNVIAWMQSPKPYEGDKK